MTMGWWWVRRGINRTGLPALGREESWDVKDPICSAVVGDSLPVLPPVCEPHQPPPLPRGCRETDKQHGHYHWCLKGGEGPARRGSWPLWAATKKPEEPYPQCT